LTGLNRVKLSACIDLILEGYYGFPDSYACDGYSIETWWG